MSEPVKPSTLPEWASEETKDPVSEQSNIDEPPAQKKKLGWSYREKPPRQWLNWLHKTTYDWLKYFDCFLNRPVSYTRAAVPSATENKGLIIYLEESDILVYSNGTNWVKLKTDGNI